MSLAPGAAAIDIETAVTGHDPFNPEARVSGTSRAVSGAGSLLPIVGAIKKGKKLLGAAERLRENWKAGREFERTVIAALGEVKNVRKFEATLRSGKIYRTIPDVVSVTDKAILEIKRVSGLGSLTPQLEAQILAAKDEQLAYRLILGPNATIDGVAGTIKDFLGEKLPKKSSIVKFDPVTRKLVHLWPLS